MKATRIIISSILVLIACNILAQSSDVAMKQLEMKQYNKAKAAFIENLKVRNSASDWYYLGKTYLYQGKTDSAAICFAKIAFADPKSILSIIAQAMIESASGKNSQAKLTLEKAQKMAFANKDISSLVEIAPVRYQVGDTATWLVTLALASEMEPKNPKPYIKAGELYLVRGENSKRQNYFLGLASGRYEQALYYAPQNNEARTGQAEIFLLGGNYNESGEYLDMVLSKDSNYIPALKIYGELEYTLGKYDKASALFGRYMAIAEYSDKDLSRYITILYFNKEYAKANALIMPVLAKEPENAVMLRLNGYTCYELGKYPEGLAAMTKFFDLRTVADTNKIIPSDYEYTGKLYSRSGNDSLSILYFKKAIEMDSTKSGLLEDISKSYEKQKKYLLAVENYKKYILYKNGNVASAIYFSLGKDLLLLANEASTNSDSLQRPVYLANADSAFSKVIEMSPNSYLGYLWHARVAAALDPETIQGLAKPDYEKALSILEQKTDKEKYKSDLIEGYRYMGYYTYLQYETAKNAKDDLTKDEFKNLSYNYWQKVLDIDPENDVAKQAMNALKK
jgi:Tfp pilus assembly protein PilF